jgi:DNA-binding MarR family transcriptional regulator
MTVSGQHAGRRGLGSRTSYRFSIIASRQARCLAAMHAGELGLSVNGWKLLSVIEHFGPLSASEAGAHTSLDATKVTRGIDMLAARGLVRRRQDPADRRRAVLSLSAKGRRLHERIEQVSRALEQELLRMLSPAELRTFDRLLDKLERRSAQIFAKRDAWRQIVHGARRPAR